MKKQSKAHKKSSLEKKDLTQSSSMIIGIMFVTMLAVVGGVLLSKELIADIAFKNRVTSAKGEVEETLEANVSKLPTLKSNYDSLVNSNLKPAAIFKALPTKDEFANLSAEFEAMATEANIQLNGITIGSNDFFIDTFNAETAEVEPSGSQTPFPEEVTVKAITIGTFDGIQEYVANVETFVRPTQLIDLKMSGSEPSIVAEITYTTYSMAPTRLTDETETLQ